MTAPTQSQAERNQGRIEPKGPGKWRLRFYVGKKPVTENGRLVWKRHYESLIFEGTYRQAQKKLDEERLKARRSFSGETPTLDEFFQKWEQVKRTVAETEANTVAQYRQRYKVDIEPFFGSKLLKDITNQEIEQRWIPWLQNERKLSRRTIEYSHAVLRNILELAVKYDLILKNPAMMVKLPKRDPNAKPVKGAHKNKGVLTPQEMGKLLDVAEGKAEDVTKQTKVDPWAALWALLLTGGLRPQEALALEVSDMDGNRISINKAVKQTRNVRKANEATPDGAPLLKSVEVGNTKTKKGRTVGLPSPTVELLRNHIKSSSILSGRIFRNSAGGIVDMAKLRKEWERACKRAGVPVVRLYDARHSHITALLSAGIPLKVMAERAGHSTIKLTADTYSPFCLRWTIKQRRRWRTS